MDHNRDQIRPSANFELRYLHKLTEAIHVPHIDDPQLLPLEVGSGHHVACERVDEDGEIDLVDVILPHRLQELIYCKSFCRFFV